ncbi:cytochrome P450 [Bombardia bombarda]|uniref:Cytochrome P450 n=1 Tax=Bombardia bombarda TaxID=252184 RepID=A0AA39WVE8_9PEZI|nr:cytochrome P450 [Bombardia bombarda]
MGVGFHSHSPSRVAGEQDRETTSKLSPGPPTLPLIGNLHQMPEHKNHLQFQKWANEYGPVYSLMLGTQVMIVLSSDQAVKDLLDKRSAIYSSRPESYIGQEILSGGLRPLLMRYDQTWRMVRKLAHSVLNVRVARTYVPYQDLEVKSLLVELVDKPHDFINHLRRYTTSLTTQMTFGYRMPTSDDSRLLEMFDIFESFSEMMGSKASNLLNVYPILRKLPDIFLPMRKFGKELHERERRLFMGHYQDTRARLKDGTSKPCCCIDLLRLQKEQNFSEDLACYMSGSLLQAGSETTSAVLIGFFQAMVIFPEVARLAQAELDRVCGDRLPDLNDVHDLPYIRGCMKESLRWMPTVVLGVPHAVTQDDSYIGYHIPKDATVILNVWSIHNDAKRHPDPRKFDPSRWGGDGQNSADAAANPDASKRDHFSFGAGRRICQGMHIADRSLFLVIARTLWAFDFRRAVDEETKEEVVPDMDDVMGALFIQPSPFKADIVPRSEKKKAAVMEEWDQVRELLDDNLQWKTVPEGLIWRDYDETKEDGKE